MKKLLLIACALIPIEAQADQELTDPQKEMIASAVRDHLLDPESARFKWPALKRDGQEVYCGFVNAKNRFGGYVGDKPFMAGLVWQSQDLSQVELGILANTDNEVQATGMVCSGIIATGGNQ